MLNLTDHEITNALAAYQISTAQRFARILDSGTYKDLRSAAVMIPLLQIESTWHMLLTQRSDTLLVHRGQVAFPGGAKEEGDVDLKQTALREMFEEIGVKPEDVKVLGHLGEIPVITNYIINLYVGKIPWPYELKINFDEVKSTFLVPLDWLAKREHHVVKFRKFHDREIPVIYFDFYEGQQLWGVSAEMTLALLSALGIDLE